MNKPILSRPQWLCIAYVVLHTLAHVSARWFQVQPGISVSVWYPPCGLALALLVLLGPRYTPLVYLTNLGGAWLTATHRVPWTGFFFPGLLTAVYATTAWLVRRYQGPRLLPGGTRGTWIFCLAIGGAPLVSALIGTAVISYGAMAEPLAARAFFRSLLDWWIGDASGLLIVVPAAMVFVAPWLEGAPLVDFRRWRAGEAVLALVRGLVLLGTVVLVLAVPVLREHRAFYLCFLPLVWICVHHGLPGATLATLMMMFVGLVGMRLAGTTVGYAYIFLLFEIAVAGVGLGLGTLVTRRNEAEAKLAASQAQLDRVIAGAQLGLWDWHIPTGRIDSNERLGGMLGYGAGEIEPLQAHWPTLIHAADKPRAEAALADHLAGRSGIYETEFRLHGKDGHWRWIHSRGSVVLRDAREQPLQVSGTHVDITDRKRAEAEVARLLKVIAATPDFVVTTDAAGRVIFANAALLAVCGGTASGSPWPVQQRQLEDLFPGEVSRRLRAEAIPAAVAHGAWQGEIELTAANGRTLPTSQVVLAHRDEESDAFTFSFIMRDISDQKRAEAERIEHERKLLQLQKAESLGVLAGGIAHDFNNLLTAMVGNANLARFELPPGSPAHALLANIEQAATRAAALCQQMLAYAGRTAVAYAEIDLNRLVEDTFQLLEPSLSKKIAVQFDPGRPLALVLAAGTQMQQVAMNLALNAAEAIGDREGRLTVRTRSRRFEADELGEMFPGQVLAAGDYALLEVEDTGCGMTPEVQARIFEPFFTTKFTGQGLGLAAVIGVVRSHRGAIAVQSAPGAGARFRVALPALVAKPVPEIVPPAADETWRGSGEVLVVDDDRLIRQVTTLMLSNLGFTTRLANDGVEGVEAFREHAPRLRCVLLDLTMPRMDGFEAHAEMHRLNPNVPVILMSGFSQKLFNLPPEAIHPAGVLAKPFGVKQLRARLQAALTASGQ